MCYTRLMTTDEIQKLAGLARLAITDEEAGALSADMNKILDYIKQIEGARVEAGVRKNPLVSNIVRDDVAEVATDDVRDRIKANFPKQKNGFLEINKIIQND